MKYKALSLFSGSMGLDLGIEKLKGFNLLACLEKEKVFCDTIRLNQSKGRLPSDLKVYEGDISNFNPVDIMKELKLKPGDLDLLVGGPPCQSFSTAGKRQSVEDPRGTLLWQYLKFVEVFQPKFFIMENVRGLISASLKHRQISKRPENGGQPLTEDEGPGSVIRLFSKDLQKIKGDAKYHMDIFEVNCVNYGAPQIRERVLFIGNRFNKQIEFPNPTHAQNPTQEDEQLDIFSSTKLLPWKTLRNAIGGLKEDSPELLDFSPRKKKYLSKIPEGSNWRSLPIEDQKESMGKAFHAKGGRSGWWRRLTFDLPSPTLVTMPNHASTSLCHPTKTRVLSVKEYAKIQEFPDDWEFCGSTAKKYTQIGNAVPTKLGEVAGKVVLEALREVEKGIENKKVIQNYRIIYVQSHVRTRSWFKGGKVVVWNSENSEQSQYYSQPKTKNKTRKVN